MPKILIITYIQNKPLVFGQEEAAYAGILEEVSNVFIHELVVLAVEGLALDLDDLFRLV
jgi:hypothetical protein